MIRTLGFEHTHLEDILARKKTVEGRLARGKFLTVQPGDQVRMREDTYEHGQLVDSRLTEAVVEVVKSERYPTFEAMLGSVGIALVTPRAASIDDALSEYYKYYTRDEEHRYGVVALHFALEDSVFNGG